MGKRVVMKNSDSFQKDLIRQIKFLRRSAASFDAGFEDESVRIAAVIRILLHDTRNSTSLLKHLQATQINLFSTCDVLPRPGILMADGMTGFFNGVMKPKLWYSSHKSILPVSDWWEQVVLIYGGFSLSRKELVLTAANKDGGAHVDDQLTPAYEKLVSDSIWNVGSEPVHNTHLSAIRQMAYELLRSPELWRLVGSEAYSVVVDLANQYTRQALQEGSESMWSYLGAYDNYMLATEMEPRNPVAYRNWARALSNQSHIAAGEEAYRLLSNAATKIETSLQFDAASADAYQIWGNVLHAQAMIRASTERLSLLDAAHAKISKALTIRPDDPATRILADEILAALAEFSNGEATK